MSFRNKKGLNKIWANRLESVSFLALGVLFLLVIFRVTVLTGSDDGKYLAVVQEDGFSFYVFLKERYLTWSARLPADLLATVFLSVRLGFWKISNTLVFVLLCYSIYQLSVVSQIGRSLFNQYERAFLVCISGLSIFGIYQSTFSNSIQWVTGSLNYLWPVSFGLFTLIPYVNAVYQKKTSKIVFIFSFFSAVMATYSEQVSVMLILAVLLGFFVIRKKTIDKMLAFLSVWIFMHSVVFYMAPANFLRYKMEISNWYPEFGELSFFAKFIQGLAYSLNHYYLHLTPLFILISILTIVLCLFRSHSKYIRALSFVPLLGLILRYFINTDYLLPPIIFAQEYRVTSQQSIQTVLILAPVFGLLTINLWFSVRSALQKWVTLFFWGLIFILSALIGFSPTIFGSGTRVFFAGEILSVLIFSILIGQIMQERIQGKGRFFVAGSILIFVVYCFINIYNLNSFILRYF